MCAYFVGKVRNLKLGSIMIMGACCLGKVLDSIMIMGVYCVGKVHNMLPPRWYYDNGCILCR